MQIIVQDKHLFRQQLNHFEESQLHQVKQMKHLNSQFTGVK